MGPWRRGPCHDGARPSAVTPATLTLLASRGPPKLPARPFVALELKGLLQGGNAVALAEPGQVGVELPELGREGPALALGLLEVAQQASYVETTQEGDLADRPGDGSLDAPRPLDLHGL